MRKLVGVYNANGGVIGELGYFFGHLIGVRECSLCDITHSPIRKKAEWKVLEQSIASEHEFDFQLLHLNERTEKQKAASEGRVPCVMLEHDDESYSIVLDWNDLKAADGDVASFEKILKSKLMMY